MADLTSRARDTRPTGRTAGALALAVGVLALVAAGAVTGPRHEAGAASPGYLFTQTTCEEYSDAITRLYDAAFDRHPDRGGFDFWMSEYTSGRRGLPAISAHFTVSDEFADTYGQLDDQAFVELLYRNVHDRPADAEGLSYWIARLRDGLPRARLLLRFSESPENVEKSSTVAPALGYYNEGAAGAWECPGWPSRLPVTVGGDGSTTAYVQKPSSFWVADVRHTGDGPFRITSFDADGRQLEVLAEGTGRYAGRHLVDLYDGDDTSRLQVEASGTWGVSYRPFSDLRVRHGSTISGEGDDAFLLPSLTRAGTTAGFSYPGTDRIRVAALSRSRLDVLANDVGPYSGRATVTEGTGAFEVSATGAWTISLGNS